MSPAARPEPNGLEIAIVGMSCHFPGAPTLEAFLDNLRRGVESVRVFTDAELLEAGVSPALLSRPSYVKAGAVLDGIFDFDAGCFGYTPREAELIDPQQRLFLERAAEALERAGHDPARFVGKIGVYAGVTNSSYAPFLLAHPGLRGVVDGFQVLVANDRDFLASRVAYKLDLQGPAVVVQTACSTSLAAVHLACQALLAGDCDMALAGGVSVRVPHQSGYMFQEEGIASPDGHCRPFDARAKGTVPGNGVGVVVLRRLADALASGDAIAAVIRGSAINNDGAGRLGFTAPRIEGQAQVIQAALAMAEVSPASISYVEAHGTATALGDPIEIAALNQAFAEPGREPCALGSVKGNFGHLDAAAGVAGLVKTALSLEHRVLFPSLNFEKANPTADFAGGPFRVNTSLASFPNGSGPRRAGVSSFGMGGTNVHVVLEEAPPSEAPTPAQGPELVVLSAHSESALEQARERLSRHLRAHPDLALADVAFTLAAGRRLCEHRLALAADDLADAASALEKAGTERLHRGHARMASPPVAFLFTGQGAQRPGMTQGLYEGEPVYRRELDACVDLLRPLLGRDLHGLLRPSETGRASAEAELRDTALAQPALFAVEYALARLWMSWGVEPQAMLGHSVGEYVAACLSGVFGLPDALSLIVERGRLMGSRPPGAMLAVLESTARLGPALEDGLCLAALNAPRVCVLAGSPEAVTRWERRFAESGVACTRLHTSHAFHSPDMEAVVAPFRERVALVSLHAPSVPFVSNVTGTWITAAQARDPNYWARHLRAPVQFAPGIATLGAEPGRVFLEIGPGDTLAALARLQVSREASSRVVASLPSRAPADDQRGLLDAAARLWSLGVPLDATARFSGARRRRVTLPTYPYERRRYAIERPSGVETARPPDAPSDRRGDEADWLYAPSWRRLPPLHSPAALVGTRVCLFMDGRGVGERLAARLRAHGAEVVEVRGGRAYEASPPGRYVLDLEAPRDYERLFAEMGHVPDRIVHLSGLDLESLRGPAAALDQGFFGLMRLVRALGARHDAVSTLTVVTHAGHEVTGRETLSPFAASVLAASPVIAMEHGSLRCRTVDVDMGEPEPGWLEGLLAEVLALEEHRAVALRGRHRWAQHFDPIRFAPPAAGAGRLRERGAYLITGGLGGIGLAIAGYLARTVSARLVLVSRRGLRAPGIADAVARLEAAGGEVMVASADVADRRQMEAVVKDAERHFGALHGVVHAAGRPGAGLIALTSPEAMRAVLAPKVEGALVLDELFHGRALDFMLLCSSLTGVRGAVGQADYAAGNAFLDVLAQRATVERPERLTIAIAWDTWRESGMAVEAELPEALAARREELLRFGLTDAEGARVFRRALDLGLSRILVSTRPLAGRWTEAGTTPGRPPVAVAPAPSVAPSLPRHPRPVLQNDYVGPRNDVERGLADAWQRVLGIDRVGVTDNFFELGGESLSALRLVALLEQTQQIRLSLVGLYETPTIEGLAAAAAVSAAPVEAVEAVLETSGRRGETRAEALAMRRQGRRGAADGGVPRGDAE